MWIRLTTGRELDANPGGGPIKIGWGTPQDPEPPTLTDSGQFEGHREDCRRLLGGSTTKGGQAELRARLEDVIAPGPQYPMLVYNLACSESLSGRTTDAIAHLRRAVDASERIRADSRKDSDFDPIRDEPRLAGADRADSRPDPAVNRHPDVDTAALKCASRLRRPDTQGSRAVITLE